MLVPVPVHSQRGVVLPATLEAKPQHSLSGKVVSTPNARDRSVPMLTQRPVRIQTAVKKAMEREKVGLFGGLERNVNSEDLVEGGDE